MTWLINALKGVGAVFASLIIVGLVIGAVALIWFIGVALAVLIPVGLIAVGLYFEFTKPKGD